MKIFTRRYIHSQGHPKEFLRKIILNVIWKQCLLEKYIACKYIQCIFYTFYMCPTFHCNLTVLFTFICCSKYKWNECKADLQLSYCHFCIGLYKGNICKVYTFYMCPVSTVISLCIFALRNSFAFMVNTWKSTMETLSISLFNSKEFL